MLVSVCTILNHFSFPQDDVSVALLPSNSLILHYRRCYLLSSAARIHLEAHRRQFQRSPVNEEYFVLRDADILVLFWDLRAMNFFLSLQGTPFSLEPHL